VPIALVVALGCQPGTEPPGGGGGTKTGALIISVSGLPGGGAAAVLVTGSGGYQHTLTGSETISGLGFGTYTVTASNVTVAGDRFDPATASQAVSVSTNSPAANVSIAYSVVTGRMAVTISGVPAGSTPAVQLAGPAGYFHTLVTSETVTGLSPGEYTLTTSLVLDGGYSYLAVPSTQNLSVQAGATTPASVVYVASTGSLALTVSGLPAGTSAQATVTGPGGFSQTIAESQTLTGLTPGSYSIAAATVTVGGTVYTPNPASQSASVVAGVSASAEVAYGPQGGGSLDLRVDGVYLTQATQRYDGTVPLVAGRDAYLRAFALANEGNQAQPVVRVRLYQGATLIQTYSINASVSAVPTVANEGVLAGSWNVLVPGALVQPGLRVLADVDPGNTIGESNEANNQFPVSGQPAGMDVRALPTFTVRFVPVLQQVNGTTGNVNAGNLESYLNDLKMLLPVGAYDADLRAVYTTTAPVLQSDNANNAWTTILSEILALRTLDGSTRYYYGVVHTTYSSGTAGMGYVGGSARTAIGWDHLPSGSRVMAHEVGHNMGLLHAPCGGVLGSDPSYPYTNGAIGVWGLQLNGLVLKSPTLPDFMGYCQPNWVSDYHWSGMMTYRQGGGPSAGQGGGQGLLVWGRITPLGVVLEPAFQVPLGPVPTDGGPNQVELLRADGSVLRSARFEAPEIGDLPGAPERHFSVVVPLGTDPTALAGLRVRTAAGIAERKAVAGPDADPQPAVTRVDSDRIAVRWNASRYPMVLVRDAATGRVLSFARGGHAVLWSRAGVEELNLQFSDGVQTVLRRERVLR